MIKDNAIKYFLINNGYSKKLTIDREDNNSGYSPDNCRWVDMRTQARNRRNNVLNIETVREMRALFATGCRSKLSIAKEFGVDQGQCNKILLNKQWVQ